MQCFGDVFLKTIDVDVFDDVLQNAKHWAYDASNDVNRPPLWQAGVGMSYCNCKPVVGKKRARSPRQRSVAHGPTPQLEDRNGKKSTFFVAPIMM